MDFLQNGILSAAINPKGAELYSLELDGIERIWQGDPAIWGRHAPLLFPFIGRLKDQQYELDGQMIQAPMHGFCRDRMFETVEADDLHVRYRTQDDEETRAVYPFSFTLEVEFRLEENTLIKRHTVTNRSDREMPFELGKANVLREGTDVVLFACGIMVGESLEAAKALEAEGISAAVVNIHTIKPIDRETVLSYAKKCKKVVTVEEHSIIGGLGDAVADVLMGNGDFKFKKVGVMDRFGQSGTPAALLEEYGLTARHIAEAAKSL